MNQNETTKKLADLKAGDTAVIYYYRRDGGDLLTPVTVTKVLPSGKIKTRATTASADRIWMPLTGSEYGHKYGSESLRPLADGETAESIWANDAAMAFANRTEADAKEIQRKEDVAKWWFETGGKMWSLRVTIPNGFMGKEVNVIRFERNRKQYMPFVIVETKTNDWNGKTVIEARVGGLNGSTYEDIRATKTSISTYSSSDHEGETLQDVLYSITH